jgi:uncharacterized iron-regulated membrane protein
MAVATGSNGLYRTLWRWHFYAALFVVPLVVILSLTGSVYLFKPQLDRLQQASIVRSATRPETPAADVTADAQRDAVMKTYPGWAFQHYRLPERDGDPALLRIAEPSGPGRLDVLVARDGAVLGAIGKDDWWSEWVSRMHGELLVGDAGSLVVELAANWAIVMVLTGLYLWWPRGVGLAGVLWPRIRGGGVVWRDWHAVIGFWISGLVLVLLLSGLPWTGVWGDGFKWLRAEMGWNGTSQDWQTTRQAERRAAPDTDLHAHHGALPVTAVEPRPVQTAGGEGLGLTHFVTQARSLGLAHPVIVTAPGGPKRFGRGREAVWAIRSDNQDRRERTTLRFAPVTGEEVGRETFSDQHVLDRLIGYGISWHEGQLFGAMNVAIGLLTALGLLGVVVSGTAMWFGRMKQRSGLGAPPPVARRSGSRGWASVAVLLCLLLPLLAVSAAALWLLERLVLRRIPAAAAWLGLLPSRL